MRSRCLGGALIAALALTGTHDVLGQSGGAQSPAVVATAPEAALRCGGATGVRFNLEPRADPLPQNGAAVDFLPDAALDGGDLIVGAANDMRLLTAGSGQATDFRGVFGITSQTGFYVHRGSNAAPCAPDLEGGLGAILHPVSGNRLVGTGYAAVAAYPLGQSIYLADTRIGEGEGSDSAIGVFRTTAAILDDPTVCPDGTLSETQAMQCWPTHTLVDLGSTFTRSNSSPHLAVDERALGSAVGAGDVYVVGTQFGTGPGPGGHSSIFIVACRNDLSACSPPVNISGSDFAGFGNIAIRPDGGVTATYTVASGGLTPNPTTAEIKYVTCQPRGAPSSVTCSAPSLIAVETQAIPLSTSDSQGPLISNKFVLDTFPKHAHRSDANGTETYVVWDRCKVSTAIPYPGLTFVGRCPDTDIVMAASTDNGATWHFGALDVSDQDQYQPSIVTDRDTGTLHIAYYWATPDSTFQHRALVVVRQIVPGALTPDAPTPPQLVTTVPLEPNGDPVLEGIFIGHYLGIAARTSASGSRAYVHYTHTSELGIYNGVSDPEQNNHLSRVDF